MLPTFEQAGPEDLPTVLDILNEAAAWLQERRIKQWPPEFGNGDDWRAKRILKYLTSGESWLVKIDGKPVATFNLTDQADPDYAEDWPEGSGHSLYIFRMAVRRSWSGHDLGTQILDWANAHAKATGHPWLRLDCHRHNQQLQRYYEDRGFVRVNTVVRVIDDNGQPYTRGSGALYQRSTDQGFSRPA